MSLTLENNLINSGLARQLEEASGSYKIWETTFTSFSAFMVSISWLKPLPTSLYHLISYHSCNPIFLNDFTFIFPPGGRHMSIGH